MRIAVSFSAALPRRKNLLSREGLQIAHTPAARDPHNTASQRDLANPFGGCERGNSIADAPVFRKQGLSTIERYVPRPVTREQLVKVA
jgi:hypothetical protein